MRLRYILLLIFLFLTALPLTIFWAWPHSQALQSEINEVRDRHLLLARNLGTALQRYYRDVTSVFNLLVTNLAEGREVKATRDILLNLGFQHIYITNEKTGKIYASFDATANTRQTAIKSEILKKLSKIARENETAFSEVMPDEKGASILYLVRRYNGFLSIGIISTDYFVKLGKAIAFGIKGHAAIVDHKGNVLAHPLDSWIKARKNISKVSAVRKMLNGETGIDTFFSPALKGDMIAGFTAVPGPGWGVMIPQPIEELKVKAGVIERSALTVFGIGILVACIGASIFSYFFSLHLERISKATRDAASGTYLTEIVTTRNLFTPLEIRTLQKNFNAMVKQLKNNFLRINRLAFEDNVTGLPNRTFFMKFVKRQIKELSAEGTLNGLLIFIDLDGFKAVNDTYGHDMGDLILRQFADRVTQIPSLNNKDKNLPLNSFEDHRFSALKEANIFARLGGDEFAVFIPDAPGTGFAESLVKDILEVTSLPFMLEKGEAVIGASLGLAFIPQDCSEFEELLRISDMAMYHAKKSGKNQASFYSRDMDNSVMEVDRLRLELHEAARNNQLQLQFQPRFDNNTKSIEMVEALIRWQHPKHGLILPDSFLPLIEDTDFILEIDKWVIDQVIESISDWYRISHNIGFSLNLSARFLSNGENADYLIRKFRQAGVDPTRIEVELTEHALISDKDSAKIFIRKLHEEGIRVALDDFGRGYSNFSRLMELDIDIIKLDQSLITVMSEDKKAASIIRALIAMASGVGCHVVAEGVETVEQAVMLDTMGCPAIQGYLISRPLPASEVSSWLEKRNPRIDELQIEIRSAFEA